MNLLSSIALLLGRLQKPSAASAPALAEVLHHETQTFGETLARVAESQIGKGEQGGNNVGPDVVEYQKATWFTPGPWAWCAAFVCWCVLQTIKVLGMSPAWPRPRTAGAYDFEQWAAGKYGRMFGAFVVITSRFPDKATWPRRGDIVTFTWPHIGIVTGYDPATRRVSTVEGNAGLERVSDSAAGDGVVAKEHHITKVRRLIRYVG
jgi:hypothetical protein